MKIIFTSDWQCDFENLDQMEIITDQIYAHRPNVVVIPGDLKARYNPVDVRTVNFVVYFIDRFKKAAAEVLIGLGNHDRVGMTSDGESWFPTLEKAGARTFSEPEMCRVGKVAFYFLPFRTDPSEARLGAKKLLGLRRNNRDSKVHILCFHQGLKEAKYNAFTLAEEEELSVEDLFPKCYDYLVGGHIHLFQRVRYPNVFYVGSPFATDWGEANQKKGFLLLED